MLALRVSPVVPDLEKRRRVSLLYLRNSKANEENEIANDEEKRRVLVTRGVYETTDR